jgi:hypothetical protein
MHRIVHEPSQDKRRSPVGEGPLRAFPCSIQRRRWTALGGLFLLCGCQVTVEEDGDESGALEAVHVSREALAALEFTSQCQRQLTTSDESLFEQAFALVQKYQHDVEDHIDQELASGNPDSYVAISADRMDRWRGGVAEMGRGDVKVACEYNATSNRCANNPGTFGWTFGLDPLFVWARDRVHVCIDNVRAQAFAGGALGLTADTLALRNIGPARAGKGTSIALSRTRVLDGDGASVFSALTLDIDPGKEQSFAASVDAGACEAVTYTIEADHAGAIDEADEDNNTALATLHPSPAVLIQCSDEQIAIIGCASACGASVACETPCRDLFDLTTCGSFGDCYYPELDGWVPVDAAFPNGGGISRTPREGWESDLIRDELQPR